MTQFAAWLTLLTSISFLAAHRDCAKRQHRVAGGRLSVRFRLSNIVGALAEL
jgi:hypothetical protein